MQTPPPGSRRPAYHFTPARNWLNDPNGLVHHDGEYHLFFQYNPDGESWGNMSWGHAVSPDLVRWDELPLAISHDAVESVFSGSAVLDRANTSGLGTADAPAMVAIYTSAYLADGRQAQSLAFSTDRGRTWTKYADNPVLDIGSTDFRDPKVQWFEPTRSWLMAVARSTEHRIAFYSSPNLKDWALLSEFGPRGASGGVWECPDLFALRVDDDGPLRWVLVVSIEAGGVAGGSATQYFLGDFDGTSFVADDESSMTTPRWLDHGKDCYAAVSWEDDPAGRHLIGWMSNWQYARSVPTEPWRGAMTTPRRVSLRTVGDEVHLVQQPVDALAGLAGPAVGARVALDPVQVTGAGAAPASPLPRATAYALEAVIDPGDAERVGFLVHVGDGEATRIGYDTARASMFVDRTRSGNVAFSADFAGVQHAPLGLHRGRIRLQILVDRTSVEVFGGIGEVVITDQVFPGPTSDGLEMFSEGGTATFESVTVRTLAPHPG
ncbi:glycoside hydrolase family 32 protein [Nocardioides sp.]|uniref:glycoside hydrolase family 32 protein n=1 Tax=Nocardioides sp. TaxID=35761 RepID=UPI00286E21F1|nr:glycoside hydrolase family 32 protein [Nocardioides sp.]